jgi:hypothetical protein
LEGSETDPAPYIDPEIEVAVPSIDAETVQIALDEVFGTIWNFRPEPVLDGYDEANADADASCPLVIPDYNIEYGEAWYWSNTCTSDKGASYTGFVYGVQFEDWETGDFVLSGGGMAAAAKVTDAQGRLWEGSGTVYSYGGVDSTGTYLVNVLIMDGTWAWEGAGGSGWLSTGIEPGFTASATWIYGLGGAVGFDGGLFGLAGSVDTVVMDSVFLYDEALAPECALEPSGTISLRDTEGHWFDVIFDGPEQLADPINADWCDGCGGAWYQGNYIDEICLDFSALLDWEERPW